MALALSHETIATSLRVAETQNPHHDFSHNSAMAHANKNLPGGSVGSIYCHSSCTGIAGVMLMNGRSPDTVQHNELTEYAHLSLPMASLPFISCKIFALRKVCTN